ncbi:MAG: hypothetical protein H2073_15040 [Pseudomonas sp.]|uniref:hypothetical protein n=1 Tax=Stutzerimonas frequens TaxID=2968969 RepID=UPI0017A7A50A|nr:hypothetical protein [Stutzerimonas frequens]MBA4727306.1 hypothetical protein [Pseudomonas sp.]MEC7474026.1 hypothetical protein [Pseudomonadota bacterium]
MLDNNPQARALNQPKKLLSISTIRLFLSSGCRLLILADIQGEQHHAGEKRLG